jgi:PAS domain S-box-containing protein
MDHYMQIFERVISGETVRGIDATFVKKNGDLVEVHGNVTRYKSKTGQIMTQGVFANVTQDRLARTKQKKSEERYLALVDNMSEGVLQVDNDENIEYVNNRFCDMLGYTREELIGQNANALLSASKEDSEAMHEKVKERRKGISGRYEMQIRKKSGKIIWIIASGAPVLDEHGKVIGSIGINMDISESKNVYKALQESEEKYRSLVENMNEGVIRINLNDTIEYVNKSFCQMLGYAKKELVGKNRFDVLTVDKDSMKEIEKSVTKRKKGISSKYELRQQRKSGEWIWVGINGTPLYDDKGVMVGSMGIVADITNQKRFEEEINALNAGLEERVEERTVELEKANKEIRSLLQEMHHRVKNNLQIVSSLLNMQAASVDDEYVTRVFRESQDRIQTMSFIHESMYLNESMSEISVKKYLEPLVKDRVKVNADLLSKIVLDIKFPDVNFNIDTMLPIGLLLNELVTNSLKHAFPDNQEGKITVGLDILPDKSAVLYYSDNGVGFSIENAGDTSKSLGLILIDSFAMQLDGNMKRLDKPGTHYELKFKPI